MFFLGLICQEFFKMLAGKNVAITARIEVQQRFCDGCSVCIKNELQEIDDINNVRLYPKESLITFNFTKAYKLSTVLNRLSEIGYYEVGETASKQQLLEICSC